MPLLSFALFVNSVTGSADQVKKPSCKLQWLTVGHLAVIANLIANDSSLALCLIICLAAEVLIHLTNCNLTLQE